MNITHLIEALELLHDRHGDLVCVTEDGMDPSDLREVTELKLTDRYFNKDCRRVQEKAVEISC